MISKNDELVGVVTAMGAGGEGIIKENGIVIFVPFSFLGEKIKYRVLKVKKNYAFAKIIEVLTPAEERVNPKCPLFKRCGGCQLQHVKYSVQLKMKSQTVQDCFHKIAGIDVSVPITARSTKEYGYRNKLQLPVADVNGETVIGFFAEKTHRVINTPDCPITEWAKDIIDIFNEYVKVCNVKGYNEEQGTGELRHIVVRGQDNNFIVTAVTNSHILRDAGYLIALLKKKFDNVTLFHNINDKKTNVIFGDEFKLIYGEPRYFSEMQKIRYEYGVTNFLQVNRDVSEKIYRKAVELASPDGESTVIDAYSGAGLMTAMLASSAEKAIGIEIIPEAIECANKLAKINGLENKMENICGKCEEVLPELISNLKSDGKKITIVLDPPRKGCEYEVVEAVKNSNAEKIIYISCNPATLARDVGLIVGTLEKKDGEIVKAENPTNLYEITFIKPYDMFPQTKHVETLVCLVK